MTSAETAVTDDRIIGRPIPRVDGEQEVAGLTRFTAATGQRFTELPITSEAIVRTVGDQHHGGAVLEAAG